MLGRVVAVVLALVVVTGAGAESGTDTGTGSETETETISESKRARRNLNLGSGLLLGGYIVGIGAAFAVEGRFYPYSAARDNGTLAAFVPFGIVGLGVFQVASATVPNQCLTVGCSDEVHGAEHLLAGLGFLAIGTAQVVGLIHMVLGLECLLRDDPMIPDYVLQDAIIVTPVVGPGGGGVQLHGRW